MAGRLSTYFLCQGFTGLNCNSKHLNVRLFLPSNRSIPASCKMRQRAFSSQKRQEVKDTSPLPNPTSADLQQSCVEDSESENSSINSAANLNVEIENNNIHTAIDLEHGEEKNFDALSVPEVMNIDREENQSGIQFEELISMIRNAEKNILLLDRARAHAVEDLNKILAEKEALQGEINVLEMKLAETDARIKVAAQEKIHVEVLEDQLGKLCNELGLPSAHDINLQPLSKELDLLRIENLSLKTDIQALKTELSSVKNTDERIVMLEKERSLLESSLKELESKLSDSQEDVSKLSTLKVECKDLWTKVENLQFLLDKATKQADQAILVLQQNQELRKKVDKLEESLEEANIYKLSSEKMQQYNELMQQKLKLLEERLERSDEEIHSYVQLYQESVKEFQETLDSLKEESRKKALEGPVDDMPWDFWSRLLLIIDGWLLEKKISTGDATLLREMVWKRDRRVHDVYHSCKEKNEHEAISAFLRLISSATSPGLYVVHIAAEMAPVAKVGGLGDVVTGLGKALQKRGHLLEIIIPKYDCVQYDRIRDLRALDMVVESYFDGRLFQNKIWVGTVEAVLHLSCFYKLARNQILFIVTIGRQPLLHHSIGTCMFQKG
ncbi:probable starch synthase 4, chloroplastic/amyloplastic isoform X2 [Carica papaya]|uniref:probable starch synthase 4, chloroplastic/amyloplastic isoform X2 n=1 Tax=Carica papaya TaxID=3649 RepID=UPI000B8D0FA8|nr:probable starch synthase 4, chloroplastic/amyloplastic isoform X2 [Carica papaya]